MLLGILVIVLGVILAAFVSVGIIIVGHLIFKDELAMLFTFPAVLIFFILCRGAFLLGGSLY